MILIYHANLFMKIDGKLSLFAAYEAPAGLISYSIYIKYWLFAVILYK